MTMAGLWHRPGISRARQGITEAYIRETETVRQSVGLCDVTSLSKIAIQGPDATEFLNSIYTNPFAKLPVGKARYGIMYATMVSSSTTARPGVSRKPITL